MPAQPEHVFDQAAYVDQWDTWLPKALHVDVEGLPAVTVHEDRTGKDTSALSRARRDQARLEWGTRDQGSCTGWLQVAGIGGGAGEVTVHLSFSDSHDPGGQAVRDALDTRLRRLEGQVRLRVDNAAGHRRRHGRGTSAPLLGWRVAGPRFRAGAAGTRARMNQSPRPPLVDSSLAVLTKGYA